MARKKIEERVRRKVLDAHSRGLPMRKIAKECNVSLSSVSRIVKEKGVQKVQKEIPDKKFEAERQKKIAELEGKIAELERKILAMEAKKKQ
jgi:transposase